MSNTTDPIADITEEATRIIDAANRENIPLRLLGGLAIFLQCPSARSNERLQRPYRDMDFVTLSKWGAKTKLLFTQLGYTGSTTFNALHGHSRLLFWDEQHERQIDIFIDRMQMCHTLDFRSRLLLDSRTLSLSDLLLTKLQIVELNSKDLIDTITLFYDHEVGHNEQGINANYIAGLTSSDWGLQKTLEVNLQKTKEFALEQNFPSYIAQRIDTLLAAMQERPKSLGWKARSVVGERARWYELPEEVRQ
ncbi:MAG: hypothetical protein M3Z24_15840 [Chloroflexota bacterium]|nr:hypothetical protein [Chloroflexota bacterium]